MTPDPEPDTAPPARAETAAASPADSEARLHQALEGDQFTLHYQPKVDLLTGAITGAEALIRWRHPTLGLIGPGRFLPAAERFGLMPSIGAWVVREACRQARQWRDEGLPAASMAVNVSARQFRGEGFLRTVIDILAASGLQPGALELELTETVLRAHGDEMAFVLNVLRSAGVAVVIDDFGGTADTLGVLKRFPLSGLKIDPSLVRQVTSSGEALRLMGRMIEAGRDLDLRVVAEGVETGRQFGLLADRHFTDAQGFFISRPVESDAFAALLSHGLPTPGARTSGEGHAVSGRAGAGGADE